MTKRRLTDKQENVLVKNNIEILLRNKEGKHYLTYQNYRGYNEREITQKEHALIADLCYTIGNF